MAELMDYLTQAVERRASDLFFVAGGSASAKVEGQILPLDDERLLPPKTEELLRAIYQLAGRDMDGFLARGDDDFSFSVRGLARFRVNAYRQRGSMAAVVRVVAFEIPDFQALHIPPQVMDLAELTYGMVLVSGTAGSGKSTTQACILDRINRTRNCHIITLEDPIEYLHRDQKSIVSQREIAIDTQDYLSALRACLRQAPDVILLGEMRDHETIQTAMTAAETGHLLIATLHTRGGGEHHRPDHRFLSPRPAGPDPGTAELGAAHGGVPAAAARRGRGTGPRLRGDADEQRHPQHDPGREEPPDRQRHRRRKQRGHADHGPVHPGPVSGRPHHPRDGAELRR